MPSHPKPAGIEPVAGVSPIARRVIDWQRLHGRHGLPWQGTGDPYRVWLSEIMLQQTQVATVMPYYARFLQRYPDVCALAAADETELMGLWAGLGYYARARNLLACARQIVQAHGGRFPQTVEALSALPGIGRSTAGAVLSLSGLGSAPILDGNVRRVFSRHFGIHGAHTQPAVIKQLWSVAQECVPAAAPDALSYNQGLMDLGATVCTRSRPRCSDCPLSGTCIAYTNGLTDALPTPKPPTSRRTEHYEVALLLRDAAIWLEPRPARGIWAGLWMAPMHQIDISDVQGRTPCLVHELTHRRYCLYVPEIGLTDEVPRADDPSQTGRWFSLPLPADAPVPAALTRLLANRQL